jgi:hypothetical protein
VIPNTADIPGSWRYLKVSGLIGDYELENMNLAPRKNQDEIISINRADRRLTVAAEARIAELVKRAVSCSAV